MPTTRRIVKPKPTFDVDGFLRSGGGGTTIVAYQPGEVVFSQGDASDGVMYVQEGTVKLSVLSRSGQEAVVAMLETGAFFGERALVGNTVRHEAATAMTATTVLIIPKEQMLRLLHEQPEFSDRFIAHILARNIRIQEDVVDQLFNSSDKRLARALLLLAHYGTPGRAHRVLPPVTQQTLADIVGTTRSRVNFFMNKFKRLGYIEYSGGLKVNDSLVTVILRDERVGTRSSKTG
jgi:CRP/FNR family transcriptional regulator, cyclic AMP receptor protein